MAKYMIEARYTAEGTKGLARDGGTGRRAAITRMVESQGGKLEALYYAFGDVDAFIIAELPDAEAAAAIALKVAAAGGATLRTTVLLTPEQMDVAGKRAVDYRPPGS